MEIYFSVAVTKQMRSASHLQTGYMRKIFQNPVYLIGLGAFMLIMVLTFASSAATCTTEEPFCKKSNESKGTELLWEGLSLQFVSPGSPY